MNTIETVSVAAHSHPVVFFDGVCAMCNQTVNMILKLDKSGEFQFAPLQGTTAGELLNVEDVNSLKSIVVIDQSGMHRKSGAICRILFHLGGIWKLMGAALWLIPFPLRDLGYSLIARYRYRMFGKQESCRLPDPNQRDRFLP